MHVCMICGYVARRDTVIGHVALWFPVVTHSTVDCYFSIDIGCFFHGFVTLPSPES